MCIRDSNLLFDEPNNCYKIQASFPSSIIFEELGERRFWVARFIKVKNKDRGWQLIPQGTSIDLLITPNENENEQQLSNLCLDIEDLKYGYISVVYTGESGTPPMVILINLREFR